MYICTSNYSNITFFCLTRGNILKSTSKVMNKKILLSQQSSRFFLKEQNFRLIIKQISMIFRKKNLENFLAIVKWLSPKNPLRMDIWIVFTKVYYPFPHVFYVSNTIHLINFFRVYVIKKQNESMIRFLKKSAYLTI